MSCSIQGKVPGCRVQRYRRRPSLVTPCARNNPLRLMLGAQPAQPVQSRGVMNARVTSPLASHSRLELVGESNSLQSWPNGLVDSAAQPTAEQQLTEASDAVISALEFLARPILVSTAGIILEIASQRAENEAGPEYFQKLTGPQRTSWEELLMRGEPAIYNYDCIAPHFDNLAANCGWRLAHELSLEQVEAQVERSARLLKHAPNLNNYYPEAAWVVENYELIKTMFPHDMPPAPPSLTMYL